MYGSRFAFLRVFNSETGNLAKLGFKKRMSIVLSKLDLAYTVSLL